MNNRHRIQRHYQETKLFDDDEIAEIVTPEKYKQSKKDKVHIIYQTPTGLRSARGVTERARFVCAEEEYPTKEGYRCANALLVAANELSY